MKGADLWILLIVGGIFLIDCICAQELQQAIDDESLPDSMSRQLRTKFMRFGRQLQPDEEKRAKFMRFGRQKTKFMRFGRAGTKFMRFGRAKFMRFGRAGTKFMRFGRDSDE